MRIARVLAFEFVFPLLVSAQTKHTPTLDETVSLKTINTARISPDGKYVAYQVRQANWKDNEFVTQIWIVNVATGANFQLTRGKKSAGQPEWSPDGQWLAFVTEREPAAIEPLTIEKKEETKEQKKEEKSQKPEKRRKRKKKKGRRRVAANKPIARSG
jgi:Periplasmic component of the Tol biopolymer transport system